MEDKIRNYLLESEKLQVYMWLGDDLMPSECCCGCGIGSIYKGSKKFDIERQLKKFSENHTYRFFANSSHIKRFLLKHK